MTSPRLGLKLAGVTLAGSLLVLAACAGGSIAKPAPQDVGADQQAAIQASLSVTDLPSGWTSAAGGFSVGGDDPTFDKCLGVPAPALFATAPAEEDSSTFSDDTGRSIEDAIGYEPTIAAAERDFLVWDGATFAGCLKSLAVTEIESPDPSDPTNSLPAGMTVGNVSSARLPFSLMGDRSVADRLTITFHDAGVSVTEYGDILVAIKGRARVTEILFSSPASPFAAGDEEGYMAVVLKRLSRT